LSFHSLRPLTLLRLPPSLRIAAFRCLTSAPRRPPLRVPCPLPLVWLWGSTARATPRLPPQAQSARSPMRTCPTTPNRLRRSRLDFRLISLFVIYYPFNIIRVARWSLGRLLTSPAQRLANLYSRSKGETSLSR
jgi:hypothetical protein